MSNQKTHKEQSGLLVAPSMDAALASLAFPPRVENVSRRLLTIVGFSILIGIAGGLIAKVLLMLIALISNLVFFGHLSSDLVSISTEHVGLAVLVIPMLGALIIGLMVRFGSAAIRGHGIPEVMDNVLHAHSRIPARVMFLKPISAAIAIGTGGPFGAEGPIIATGGALGSVFGTLLRVSADERKVLLASGAAAGMAATFGTPVAAVLLAIELLLFEYRARSIIPVALAASAATAVRMLIISTAPAFRMPAIAEADWKALAAYILIGIFIGLVAVLITKAVYAIEDAFERLPIHNMWWPALGAIVVGIAGYCDPRILGVGYDQIENILSGELLGWSLVTLIAFKFVAWSIYLGSGTSGGTLAPLFIIGGGLGALAGAAAASFAPSLGVSVPVASLVGMAAVFAGASHALLASVVFAFEATRQPLGLLPLLAGSSAAYLVSTLLMRTSIMTEKISRRGSAISTEYSVDRLSIVLVKKVMTRSVVMLGADEIVETVRARFVEERSTMRHQGFPVVDASDRLLGVITRRDLLHADIRPDMKIRELIKRPPVVTHPGNTLREAVDHMVQERVGRLPVVERKTSKVVGIISRSDILSAQSAGSPIPSMPQEDKK